MLLAFVHMLHIPLKLYTIKIWFVQKCTHKILSHRLTFCNKYNYLLLCFVSLAPMGLQTLDGPSIAGVLNVAVRAFWDPFMAKNVFEYFYFYLLLHPHFSSSDLWR